MLNTVTLMRVTFNNCYNSKPRASKAKCSTASSRVLIVSSLNDIYIMFIERLILLSIQK